MAAKWSMSFVGMSLGCLVFYGMVFMRSGGSPCLIYYGFVMCMRGVSLCLFIVFFYVIRLLWAGFLLTFSM